MAHPAIPERNWVNIQWLARLRWAEVAGQAVTVLVAQFLLAGTLPIAALLGVVGIGLVSNLAVELYFFGDRRRGAVTPRPVHEWHIALIMMIDIAILTGLLYLTGGPTNPFSFLYLVQIALATVLVRARWTWMLVGLAFLGFGVLVVEHAFAHLRGHLTELGHLLGQPLDLVLAQMAEHLARRLLAEQEHDDRRLRQPAEHGLNRHVSAPLR